MAGMLYAQGMSIRLFEVGGCVRDAILELPTKDIDYVVVADGGWDEMISYLKGKDFEIFVESPQYLTVRAKFPKSYVGVAGRVVTGMTADFVLARKDGTYYDGRRPETVTPGTLEDDLRRRDFRMNAIAVDEFGGIIDPFDGLRDIKDRIIRTVGTPEDRFGEDALRAVRALRFSITKGMTLSEPVSDALRSEWLPPLLGSISVERRREELLKAFKADTLATFDLLALQTPAFREALFADGLRLMPTLKG